MAREVTTSYRNSTVRLWDSVDVSLLENDLISAGVGDLNGDETDCKVVAQDTPDDTVQVSTGVVYISGVDDSQEDAHTERLYVRTAQDITVPSNSTGDVRVDAIIARIDVDTEPDAQADNVGTVELVTGDGNTALDDGDITTSVGSDAWYRLANINTPDSFSTITNSEIDDTREPFTVNPWSLKKIITGDVDYVAAGGSSNAFTVTLPYPIHAYADGLCFKFKANHNINGASTVNVNSLGAKTIKKEAAGEDVVSGDIKNGQIVEVMYDGTYFQLLTAKGQETSDPFLNEPWGNGADSSYDLDGSQATVGGLFTKNSATEYQLDADAYFVDLTIANGVALKTNGYILRVKGTLDLEGGDNIVADGGAGSNGTDASDATAGSGGAGGSAPFTGGTLPDCAAGASGGNGGAGTAGFDANTDPHTGNAGSNGSSGTSKSPTLSETAADSGDGGTGGSVGGYGGQSGGGSTPGTSSITNHDIYLAAIRSVFDTDEDQNFLTSSSSSGGGGGGASGGGGAASGTMSTGGGGGGGGSGAPGGFIKIFVNEITGTGNISADGGDGGDGGNGAGSDYDGHQDGGGGGGGGGGAGGNGGEVELFYKDKSGWSGTVSVSAGSGGSGGSAGSGGSPSSGSAGANGSAGHSRLVEIDG